jgi:hypothetical protein
MGSKNTLFRGVDRALGAGLHAGKELVYIIIAS